MLLCLLAVPFVQFHVLQIRVGYKDQLYFRHDQGKKYYFYVRICRLLSLGMGSCIINNNDLSVDTNSNFALKELYIELISVDINARAWLGP